MRNSKTATFWLVLLGSVGALVAALADMRGELAATEVLLLGLLAIALYLLANWTRRTSERAEMLSKKVRELFVTGRSNPKRPVAHAGPEDGFDALESAIAELVTHRKSAPLPEDDLVAQLAEAWKQDAGTASGHSDGRLIELTNQVFVYRHLRSRLSPLDEHELDLPELVARSFARHRPEADRKHLLLLQEGRALRVRANPDVMAFSIENLIAEAVASAPGMTTITVCLAIDTAGDVRISFSDARTAAAGGAGINTMITRRLLELHGGKLLIAGRAGFNAFTSIVLPGNRLVATDPSPMSLAA